MAQQNENGVNAHLPLHRLLSLGLQHVLVMYAGAVAVPLIIGKALQLTHEQVAQLISADLFVCGIVTLIQSGGLTQWFGIRLPVIMGVTFAAVEPMVSISKVYPGLEGARILFGSIMASGLISIIILVPIMGRLLRFFPPVVTGSVITVIGITLMRVGINWIFGLPVGPTAPVIVDPSHMSWLNQAATTHPAPSGLALAPTLLNPRYATLNGMLIAASVLLVILAITKWAKGFWANIAVLLGIVAGAVFSTITGQMSFEKVDQAQWFALILPFQFGFPKFDLVLILTMLLVMIVSMIESTGMFLALGKMVDAPPDIKNLSRGLRTDGLGTFLGGLFNTFPYTSFSQNVGLVAVTGVRSRFVCVAAGGILVCLGLLPKLGALVESIPTTVLGGAGLVMFGMVAATGIRILGGVDFAKNHHNGLIVAISIGMGMIPLVAPNFKQWLPHGIHPLVESGILLASIAAVSLNLFFNGARIQTEAIVEAAEKMELS